MQIIMVQSEIEQVIRDYIRDQLVEPDGVEITINLSATRGPEGFKAIIDIASEDTTAKPVKLIPKA